LIVLVNIYSDEDCWTNENNTITKKYAVLVNFSPKVNYEKDSCSLYISNPWLSDMQNGFGTFLPQQMDCSSTVTIECVPGSTYMTQVILRNWVSVIKISIFLFCYIDNTTISAIYMSYKFKWNKNAM
jgi:hypothetical protein